MPRGKTARNQSLCSPIPLHTGVYAQRLGGVWQLKYIGNMAWAMPKVSLLQYYSYKPGSAVVLLTTLPAHA